MGSNEETKRMIPILFLLTPLILLGCASTPAPTKKLPIEWVQYDTQKEVDNACKTDMGLVGMKSKMPFQRTVRAADPSVRGCYKMLVNGTCQIHTLKRQSPFGAERRLVEQYDASLFKTIGHEIVHCFDGNYHTENTDRGF